MHDHWINEPCHADCAGRTHPEVTAYPCPEAHDGSAAHLLTPDNGVQACHYCGRTEGELRAQIVPQGTAP